MNYAPVLLPTLCRFESFVKCIESLKKNTWAENTDLIVALDYPKKESHWEGYRAIKQYLRKEDFSGFKSLQVIERRRNYGAIHNFRDLLDSCFSRYDRCICISDDLELSPDFIQYMDVMLDAYEEDPCTDGVIGYSYPVQWKVSEGCNAFLENFSGSVWGIGFWRSKFNEMCHYIERGGLVKDFTRAYRGGKFQKMTDWAINDYVKTVCYGVAGKTFINQITDISLRIYLAVKDRKFVMPVVSKVRNLGFDGSGAYCEKIEQNSEEVESSQNYSYALQPIDDQICFAPAVDTQVDIDVNRELFNRFDAVRSEDLDAAVLRAKWYCSQGILTHSLLNIKKLIARVHRGIGSRLRFR